MEAEAAAAANKWAGMSLLPTPVLHLLFFLLFLRDSDNDSTASFSCTAAATSAGRQIEPMMWKSTSVMSLRNAVWRVVSATDDDNDEGDDDVGSDCR